MLDYMVNLLQSFIATIFLLFTCLPVYADSSLLISHRTENDEIFVNARLQELPETFIQDVKNGIKKELEYNVELMRTWENWLDEYVEGKTIIRTIKYDVIKKQYHLTSLEGRYLHEKTAKNLQEALNWFTTLRNIRLVSIIKLQQGTYYVRVRMESRRIKLPPLFKVLFFFVPEVEFSSRKSSPVFPLNK